MSLVPLPIRLTWGVVSTGFLPVQDKVARLCLPDHSRKGRTLDTSVAGQKTGGTFSKTVYLQTEEAKEPLSAISHPTPAFLSKD